MVRDLENKCINRIMSSQRVRKVSGSSQSGTDGHNPSLQTPTRLAGGPMARDLENKPITGVVSLQRVGESGGLSQSDTIHLCENQPDPTIRKSADKRVDQVDWTRMDTT